MTKNDMMGHWYQCIQKTCGEKIPLPDNAFLNDVSVIVTCPECDNINLFQFSHAINPCTKEEALSHIKIKQQIKDGKIRFESFWKPENND